MRRDPSTDFELSVQDLSVSARFALAMCFVNLHTRKQFGNLAKMKIYADYVWACPLIGDNKENFIDWISREPSVVQATRMADMSTFQKVFRGPADSVAAQFQLLQLTTDLLTVSFWGAGENERTLECLRRIRSKSGVANYPSIAPFKFSIFAAGDGWGPLATKGDLDFWRIYSENWDRFLDRPSIWRRFTRS